MERFAGAYNDKSIVPNPFVLVQSKMIFQLQIRLFTVVSVFWMQEFWFCNLCGVQPGRGFGMWDFLY